MSLSRGFLTSVRRFLVVVGLTACPALMHADVIQSISIDLSPLNPGSILSGSVTLSSPLTLGVSVSIPLTFSDPEHYDPTSLATMLSVTSGVPDDQFRFSTITFTNLANNKVYNLEVRGAASCAVDFPCEATGGFQANDPPAFTGTYTVVSAAAPSGVPEPTYGVLVGGLLTTLAFGRRLSQAKRST